MREWNGYWNELGHQYMVVELLGSNRYLVRCERCSGFGTVDDEAKEHLVPMPLGLGCDGETITEYEQITCPACGGSGTRKARILVESDDEYKERT
jgi:DNA-directed RNA polymerase subunit RPC12/RpoP